MPACTLILNGEVFTPEPRGVQSVLLVHDRIAQIGDIDREQLRASGLECEVIDAEGCAVVPGLIDPHAHLVGAGGEHGFASRMPEIGLEQLVEAGITTVVGLLGTDTVTREPRCLFAKTHQLIDEGISAYMYTGGFELPPRTFTGSLLDDIILIDCVIGLGELAISDSRWIDPTLEALAFVVAQTALAGQMSGKAGVTHFHVGDSPKQLGLLNALLDNYEIAPSSVYATHISRSEALMNEGIALAERGAFVDLDAVEENIGDCLRYYLEHRGPPDRLTVSSDAHTPGGSPAKFFAQFVSCVREHRMPLEQVLPFFTRNAATALKLPRKGSLEISNDADVLILDRDSLDITHLIARGRPFIREGERIVKSTQEQQLEESMP